MDRMWMNASIIMITANPVWRTKINSFRPAAAIEFTGGS